MSFEFAAAPSIEELSKYERSDWGNAKRFIRTAGGVFDALGDVDLSACTVLYLRNRGWIAFDGLRFDLKRGEDLAHRHATRVVGSLFAQMTLLIETEGEDWTPRTQQSIRDFAVSSGNSGRLNGMMSVAAPFLTVDLEDFDQDPMALNCRNGVLRFVHTDAGPKAVFSQGHDPRDRFTRMVGTDYDPDAQAPLFRAVVDGAQPVDEDRHYLHKVFGYSSTGSTEEQKFFVLQGKGGDGKSTIVNACRLALGTYATVSAIETFLDTGLKRGSEASPDVAALAGDTRFISAGEPPKGSKLATGAIKQFTGGSQVKARELRQGLFEFDPVGKPFIECNGRPAVNDTDDGIWRRLKIIPFRIQVPDDQIDRTLPRKLKAELPGILNWLVEGVLLWMAEGLKDPQSVIDAIEDYRKGSNEFVQWLDARTERDDGHLEEATALYTDYKDWAADQGHERVMSQKSFGKALGDMQILSAGMGSNGRIRRRGLRLKGGVYVRAAGYGPGAGGPEGDSAFDTSGPNWERE